MTTPTRTTQIIDLTSDHGKQFVEQLNSLKKELKLDGKGEKIRQYKELSSEQIESNPFLIDFIAANPIFKEFEIKKIVIGNFGRKVGFVYPPIAENLFRIFIHFGDNEVYYMDNYETKDKMLAVSDGQGFIISSIDATQSSITVYSDPIRIIHDPKVKEMIPKIRPRNYSRTTLVYDLLFNMNLDDLLNEENEENENQVEEKIEENNQDNEEKQENNNQEE